MRRVCGRITLTAAPSLVAEVFGLGTVPDLRPRYNIAPSQPVPVVRLAGDPPTRRLDELQWGLIPSWAKDPGIGHRMINARAETLEEKPAFRAAFRSRRCLVVADGFYEWRHAAGRKQPYLVRLRDRRPFAMAGLWECWRADNDADLLTFTIVTTAANRLMAPIHDRMPVLLAAENHSVWLDPHTERAVLLSLLAPFCDEALETFAVSAHVNNPRNDDEECVKPVQAAP